MTGYSREEAPQHACPFCSKTGAPAKKVRLHAVNCPEAPDDVTLAGVVQRMKKQNRVNGAPARRGDGSPAGDELEEGQDLDELDEDDRQDDETADEDEDLDEQTEDLQDAAENDSGDHLCPYCEEEFDSGKAIGGHKRWCDGHPDKGRPLSFFDDVVQVLLRKTRATPNKIADLLDISANSAGNRCSRDLRVAKRSSRSWGIRRVNDVDDAWDVSDWPREGDTGQDANRLVHPWPCPEQGCTFTTDWVPTITVHRNSCTDDVDELEDQDEDLEAVQDDDVDEDVQDEDLDEDLEDDEEPDLHADPGVDQEDDVDVEQLDQLEHDQLTTRELELLEDLAEDRLGSTSTVRDDKVKPVAWLWVRARQLLGRGPP